MTGLTSLARVCANVKLGATGKGLALAAAGLMASSAHAVQIFDTLTNGGAGFAKSTFSQCLTCTGNNPTISELGDIITFAGTERLFTTARVTMSQFGAAVALNYFADVTMKVYTPDGATVLASKTETVNITAGNADYTFTFDFTSQNVVLPNTVYYGISVGSVDPLANNLWLGLWDYYSQAFGGDGQAPLIGTDPGTLVSTGNSVSSIMYGRLLSNPSFLANSNGVGLGANDLDLGYTPNVEFNAVPVPEPSTYGLMFLGLVAVGAAARRKLSK